MSRANAQVKFPDGTIRYGIYNGTVDVYWPYLFDNSEDAWEAWNEYYNSKPMDDSKWDDRVKFERVDGPFYDVEIADDYGSGDAYYGKATKNCIVSSTNTEYMTKTGKGKPEWWDKNYGEAEQGKQL